MLLYKQHTAFYGWDVMSVYGCMAFGAFTSLLFLKVQHGGASNLLFLR